MDLDMLLNPYARGAVNEIAEPVAADAAVSPETAVIDEPVVADTFDEIVADSFETVEHTEIPETITPELVTIPEPTPARGKHRADVPPDSVSPLLRMAPSHRLSA